MANKQLVDYIKQNLGKGHNLQEIRKFLAMYGWSERDIDEGILEASGVVPSRQGGMAAPADVKVKKHGHKKLIFALIILMILIFVFLYVAMDIVKYFNNMFPNTMLPFNMTMFR
jgi:hypothetical protein